MIPRNIRRVEPWKIVQIMTLIDSIDGNVGGQVDQDRLYDELAGLGVKSERGKNGVNNAGGFRTYLAQLACLGLYVKTKDGYEPTRAGECMLSAQEPVKVLRCQLLRMQYPSVYGLGQNVRISKDLRVKPFVFLLRLLQDERVASLTSEEVAVAVIYGRSFSDYEKCVEKILRLRRSGGTIEALMDIVDNVVDVCTPKRQGGEDLLKRGCIDAKEIGNTFLNYLMGSSMVDSMDGDTSRKILALSTDDLQWLSKYESEFEKTTNIEVGQEENWQRHFGRYDRQKGVRPVAQLTKKDGFVALIRVRYIEDVAKNPYGFDHESFVCNQAQLWGKSETVIASACDSLRSRIRTIERDVLETASVSGGKESRILEVGLCNIFRKLGFDNSLNTSGRKAVGRRGGFPDTYIKSSQLNVCGFADAKATARYGFNLDDMQKLASYYNKCEKEIDGNVDSTFFIYVAGGFDKSESTILHNLKDCAERYGRPVSAVTLRALLDLVEDGEQYNPRMLMKAFETGRYFNSSVLILRAVR